MLGSSIDKSLMDSPLAGGQQTLGGPSFRQPGDMGRYIAFNDPGQPGAGFSNYQDYLAAGNKLPELKNFGSLEAANPLTDGPVTQEDGIPPLGANMFMGNATLPNLPPSLLELNPIKGGAVNPRDEFQRGYLESEFYSPRSTMDVQKFKYKGKDMEGSGTYVSGFEKYLESIGQGNLFERPSNELAFAQESGPLAQIGGGIPRPPGFDSNYGRRPNNPNDPILSLKPDFELPTTLEQADPNNLLTGPLQPSPGSLFPFPGMNNTEIASASDQRGLPSILGINPMGQQSSFEQTFNDKQGLDTYVDDLVNERLRDIFGGIMGAINV